MNNTTKQQFNAQIGRRIRSVRMKRGMPVERLGEVSGIAASRLRGYECGRRSISVDELERIGDALQLPVTHFLTGCSTCGA